MKLCEILSLSLQWLLVSLGHLQYRKHVTILFQDYNVQNEFCNFPHVHYLDGVFMVQIAEIEMKRQRYTVLL